jgi:hypothetical protein
MPEKRRERRGQIRNATGNAASGQKEVRTKKTHCQQGRAALSDERGA